MAPERVASKPAEDRLLYGSVDVILAPVQGKDRRRELPKEIFVKRPGVFSLKFGLAMTLVVAGWVAMALFPTWPVIVVAGLVLGLAYAHLVELQHECLHEHAYGSRRLNRLVGFLCGVPMLSSFWHYKYEHLRHHAYLGTPRNQEFFNYRFHDLDSVPGFLRGCFHLGRYGEVFTDIGRSLLGRTVSGVTKTSAAKKIRTEYLLFAVVLVIAVAFTVVTRSPLILFAWVLPTLLVAEPTHFLIELPEHFGLNTQTDPNVLTNTRTIRAGRFARWFTNGNDLHTAHHFHQGVPMARIPELHGLIQERIATVESSYWSFYRKVLTGELRYQNAAENCMTR
ncbi:fatty acid desaturase family protein [Actinomadura rudentiformis]|uniref:Fatty acid desaturase n=1 Tax=Actinomadura rudentiformis TaxID=359158 RepID=A0A6H9YMR7_9ACTN|nr:fatty acid desaturase [Actinomadura rudentiformis]KAB2343598.1 fatty acid desaturase [Actinomadura rudentiformis]